VSMGASGGTDIQIALLNVRSDGLALIPKTHILSIRSGFGRIFSASSGIRPSDKIVSTRSGSITCTAIFEDRHHSDPPVNCVVSMAEHPSANSHKNDKLWLCKKACTTRLTQLACDIAAKGADVEAMADNFRVPAGDTVDYKRP